MHFEAEHDPQVASQTTDPSSADVAPSPAAPLGSQSWDAAGGGRHPLVVIIEQLKTERDAATRETENLRVALVTSRLIGTAVGILMHQRSLSADDAYELISKASQRTNRKVRDIASDIAYTGELNPAG